MALNLDALSKQIANLTQIKEDQLPTAVDHETKKKLQRQLNRLIVALDDPSDIVDRLIYSPVDGIVVYTALQLGLFELLSKSEHPLTIKDIASSNGADPILLGRILRILVNMDAISEASIDSFAANKTTRAFTTNKGIWGTRWNIATCLPLWEASPSFLADTGYKNPSDPTNVPVQRAFNFQGPVWAWLPTQPERLEVFNQWMCCQRDGRSNWLDFFPVQDRLNAPEEGGVSFVDVGGAFGAVIQELKGRFTDLKGRMILQDLPPTLGLLPNKDKLPFEVMPYDFFTTQPIKGAHVYHLRNILHDWPDKASKEILTVLKAAMVPGRSKILLNELVIPDNGEDRTPFGGQVDWIMLSAIGGMERTESHWRELISSVGLTIDKIWTVASDHESIIEISTPAA